MISALCRKVWQKYRQAYSGLPKEVWYLSIALFINRSGAMVLAFMTLYLTEEIGFGESGAGRMMSIYGVGAIVGNYLGGRFTNWAGSVRLQIILLLISGPMYLLIPLSRNWQEIGISIFLLSLFAEAVRPPNATAIAQFTPKELQPRAYALQRMAVNLGVSIGPVVGGYLSSWNFFSIFVVDAATTWVGAAFLFYFFGFGRFAKTLTAEQKQAVQENIKSKTTSPLKDANFMILLGLLLATGIVFFQFHGMYPLYVRDHFGLDKSSLGKLYAVNTVIIVFFEMLLIDFIRDWNKIKIVGVGCFLSCFGFGMMPFSSAVSFCVLSMVILTIGEMLSFPVCSGWIGQRSERGDRAMYMGWYTMNYSIAAILGPAIGGEVYAYNKELFWYISLGIGVAVLIGALWLSKRIEREKMLEEIKIDNQS